MKLARRLGIALAACAAVAVSGCGLGEGETSEGEATLTVTRDFGTEPMVDAAVTDPAESETVIRMLDSQAEITTRYGGGFVQSIEGVAGEIAGGRSVDWFFFVNGIESPTGAADVPVRGGDRVWWDYRDWTDAMRAPAVVGSWPEPFAQAATPESEREPVIVECFGEREPCDTVSDRLGDEGVEAAVELAGGSVERGDARRLLVGPWEELASEPPAPLLDDGPATSGVFARFAGAGGGVALEALDEHAEVAGEHGDGAGLVAALREGERPPSWLVTGTDADGVVRAAEALDAETLADRYAVALPVEGEPLALPAQGADG
jgi:hypothetical protein